MSILSLVLQFCYTKIMVNKCYVVLPLSFNINDPSIVSRQNNSGVKDTTIHFTYQINCSFLSYLYNPLYFDTTLQSLTLRDGEGIFIINRILSHSPSWKVGAEAK
jgi:hypothetical protein